MAFSKVIPYLLLPFRILSAIVGSCIFVFTKSFDDEKGHEDFMKIIDVKKDNKYAGILQQNVAASKYFWDIMKQFVKGAINETMMSATKNGVSPNPTLLKLDDGSHCKLLDLAKAGRPLVINFGSCT